MWSGPGEHGKKFCYYPPPPPPPPLNRVDFWRSRKRLKKFNKLNLAALMMRYRLPLLNDVTGGRNEHKTEEYTVPDATPIRGKDSWRKCKLLGSLLDTKEDIQRRKMITITMKENSHVYKSKYLTLSQKIRHFRVFADKII